MAGRFGPSPVTTMRTWLGIPGGCRGSSLTSVISRCTALPGGHAHAAKRGHRRPGAMALWELRVKGAQ
jgi:hypothetical protein